MTGQPATAESALMAGRVDDAVHKLQAQLATHGNDGALQLMLCRAFFSEQMVDDALPACEAAVRLMPKSSDAEDWMGRVYGVKADHSGAIGGLKLAHKVRESFEAAYALDPHNGAAANDLAEFYIGAPSLVGGGLDKADALAQKTSSDLPQVAHRIRALAAENRSDDATAEREFRAAVDTTHRPEAWVDLGGFYKRRKQYDKAVDALHHCLAADRDHGPATVDAASYLMDMHREPDVALNALQQYATGNAKTDAAPLIHVYVLMAKLQAGKGDKAGAKIDLNKALELAANYAPAKKALQGL